MRVCSSLDGYSMKFVVKRKLSFSADHLLFHQLDVADSSSVASLAEFIKTQFGRLDILV